MSFFINTQKHTCLYHTTTYLMSMFRVSIQSHNQNINQGYSPLPPLPTPAGKAVSWQCQNVHSSPMEAALCLNLSHTQQHGWRASHLDKYLLFASSMIYSYRGDNSHIALFSKYRQQPFISPSCYSLWALSSNKNVNCFHIQSCTKNIRRIFVIGVTYTPIYLLKVKVCFFF